MKHLNALFVLCLLMMCTYTSSAQILTNQRTQIQTSNKSQLFRNDNLFSVVIKSTSSDNTIFSLSKRTNEDKTITYIGRIINEKYADGYELIEAEDGGYILNKIKTDVLLQDY